MATPPPDESLPFRLKESTFRLYEPLIRECLRQWPEPVSVNPAPLRATTVAARMRDALLSLSQYRWTTDIDMEQFDALLPKIVVAHGDQTVAIGPKTKRPKGVIRSPFAAVKAETSGIHFDVGRWDMQDIEAACRLISKKLLVGPLLIRPPLSEGDASSLEARYDIASTTDSQRTTIV